MKLNDDVKIANSSFNSIVPINLVDSSLKLPRKTHSIDRQSSNSNFDQTDIDMLEGRLKLNNKHIYSEYLDDRLLSEKDERLTQTLEAIAEK